MLRLPSLKRSQGLKSLFSKRSQLRKRKKLTFTRSNPRGKKRRPKNNRRGLLRGNWTMGPLSRSERSRMGWSKKAIRLWGSSSQGFRLKSKLKSRLSKSKRRTNFLSISRSVSHPLTQRLFKAKPMIHR